MPTIDATDLTKFVSHVFQAASAPADIADEVAASLVHSNLAGHDSHGVVRVVQYLSAIADGLLDPSARPAIAQESAVAALVDARRGFGQVAARFAADTGIEKAQGRGLASVGLVNCGHVGRLGEWVERMAEAGLIGLAFCNGGGRRGAVAPFGGAQRLLGTNPIAAAVPLADRAPFLLDFATSAVAEGKVRIARNSGKSIPEGWILDKEGNPSTHPQDLYEGGMLLPAAGHKGYGLSLLVEFLGGLLTGSGCPALDTLPSNGVLFLVLDPALFRPLADFQADAEALVSQIKAVRPAAGFDRVLLPGEPEHSTAAERGRQGVPLDETTWTQLVEAAAERRVHFNG